MRTAHSIARTGHARMRDEHLVAANEPRACRTCTNTCDEGRDCDSSMQASQVAVFGPLLHIAAAARRASPVLRALAPYLAAVVAALLLAAAPVYMDGQGPQRQEISR